MVETPASFMWSLLVGPSTCIQAQLPSRILRSGAQGTHFGHLLWHTSPLSSPLSLLHLPRRSGPRRSFCFVRQDKSRQKARNKGRMLRGVLSLPNTGWTPPSPAAESRPSAPRPSGGGSQIRRWEGRGTPAAPHGSAWGAESGAAPGAAPTHLHKY